MATIVLHNGHLNIDQNPDTGLHGEYGAQGELQWIIDFQHNYLAPLLQQRGYSVKFTDGSGPNQDFSGDLFIADHYDGAPNAGRYWCCCHAANDTTKTQSDKLVTLMSVHLSQLNGQGEGSNDPSHITDNMLFYYGFTYESQPDIIIEHGNGADPTDYDWLHVPDNMSQIAIRMADAVDEYFGVLNPIVVVQHQPLTSISMQNANNIVTLASVGLDVISSIADLNTKKSYLGFILAEIKRNMGAQETRFPQQ